MVTALQLCALLACSVAISYALATPITFQPFGLSGQVMEIAYLIDPGFVYVAGLNASNDAAVTMFDVNNSLSPLVTFDAGDALQVYLFPATSGNTLAFIVVRSNGTDFYVLNSVLGVMCNNSMPLMLKSNTQGSAGLGLIVSSELWFLDPSVVFQSRNLFWNIDLISCNISNTSVPLSNANYSFLAGSPSYFNNGVVYGVGVYGRRLVLENMEFYATNTSVLIASSGYTLPYNLTTAQTPPIAVTPATTSYVLPIVLVTVAPNLMVKYAASTAWGSPQQEGLVALPTGHAITRVAYNSASTIVGTKSSDGGGGIAVVNSATLALSSFATLNSTAFSAWMSLAASDDCVCGQAQPSTVLCYLL